MKKLLLTLITSFSFFLILGENVRGESFDYSVDPILSQQNKKLGYYNIKVKNNQTLKIKFKLHNYENKKVIVHNLFNDAHNDNGLITYSSEVKDSYHLDNPTFTSMLVDKNNKSVTLKPHGNKVLTVKIKIPESGINGQVLGGVNSYKSENKNKFSFSNAILLEGKPKKANINKIFINNIKPNRYKVNLNIVNNQPVILSKYKLNMKLYNQNRKILNNDNNHYNMVPSSQNKMSFSFGDLNAGFYYLKLTIKDNDGHFKRINKYFSINGGKHTKKKNIKQTYLIAIIIAVLLAIIYFISIKMIEKIRNKI
ncbi:DUF916 domain-containing protein [Lactobacillus sp. S2-2]|uniref:WxL protein peptidoglycan domain-containing protein n=1 Tax=Lactobacillus sp. S2-2 TaxID=2692917 RepID=UPI001F1D9BAC|nr:DUF916 domain-containing protein [Lactobacillus sp. S2-2]MCF6515606.1 DUF916 domain-containing protein [Lactobacillus sp. S2-2]